MGKLLYRFFTGTYFFLIRIGALYNTKASQFIRGRKKLFHQLEKDLGERGQPLVWFHAASLGEFEQGRPVIEAIKKIHPDVKVLLTFFSASGYEIRKNYSQADYVSYLPIETPSNVRRFYDLVQPQVAIFIKYEFWRTYILEARKRNIHLLSISAIFRKEQPFFRPWGSFFRKTLQQFDHFFVQDAGSKDLLQSIGISQVSLAGDTRFDRVVEVKDAAREIDLARAFCKGEKIVILGSVWPDDMAELSPVINQLKQVKWIIAPHQIEPSFLAKVEANLALPMIRFSQATVTTVGQSSILVVDNIGMLSSLYKYGDIAYVGGGFHGGLHNTLEPAAFSIPVVWGQHPRNRKFLEATALEKAGGGFPVKNAGQLLSLLGKLLADDGQRALAGYAAGNYVASHTGATALILNYLVELLMDDERKSN